MSVLELFCEVDDFWLDFEPQWKAASWQQASSESVQDSSVQAR
ncbi:MAG: hypothetical protein PVS3B3_38430 [Ktedonobacteraceae bacterium]